LGKFNAKNAYEFKFIIHLLMSTIKQSLNASNHIDGFVKCSHEPYTCKSTFISEHVFSVCHQHAHDRRWSHHWSITASI